MGAAVMATAEVATPKIHRGLAGVYIDRSEVCMIDGSVGTLSYRGYAISDLVDRATFEETAFLLIHGRLPGRKELDQFETELQAARCLPESAGALVHSLARAHPMDALRTVVSALACDDPDRFDDSPDAMKRKATRLISQAATAVAWHHAIRCGRRPVHPNEGLGHAANLLHMLTGKSPDAEISRLFDQDFIVHAEHGSNASAFAGRVVIGAGADFHAAMTGAIACFAGASHGGAVEGVMRMVREIEQPDKVKAYIAERRRRREPVMGFGHRVYRTADPRARYLRQHAQLLSGRQGDSTWLEILDRIVDEMAPYTRHNVNVNVDFYAAISYALLGIPDDLFGAVFALSRLAGWTAQLLEQKQNNILIRPLLLYVGERDRAYLRSDQR